MKVRPVLHSNDILASRCNASFINVVLMIFVSMISGQTKCSPKTTGPQYNSNLSTVMLKKIRCRVMPQYLKVSMVTVLFSQQLTATVQVYQAIKKGRKSKKKSLLRESGKICILVSSEHVF